MQSLKLLSIIFIFLMTLLAGLYPFIKKLKTKEGLSFPIGESIAAGVFLGAGLMHMMGDASNGFDALHYTYPFAFLIAGITFLIFLLLEHIGREIYQHRGGSSTAFAILATIMLSIHSFFTGAALGISDSNSIIIVVLLAILAHKWAASFTLAVQINKSPLRFSSGILLFAIFALMVPMGIAVGSATESTLNIHPMVQPVFSAIAAGTFLYLGTLHGLEQATLIKQCCSLSKYYFVILGFAIMAVVAIWT